MDNTINITSAQYYNDLEGNQLGIRIVVGAEIMDVPFDPANRHYAEIQRQVEADELTIADAD